MLKKLYEEHFLEIDALLTKQSKRLKLTPNELIVLKTLFQMYKRKTFSVTSITRRIELSANEIERAVDLLAQKGFVSFSLETRNDKQVEVFDLSQTFDILTTLYEEDIKQDNLEKAETQLSQTISLFEKGLGKALSATELEMIRSWYEQTMYPHEHIISKINEHIDSGRFSVKFIERTLNQTKLKKTPRDAAAESVIDQIFKAIK